MNKDPQVQGEYVAVEEVEKSPIIAGTVSDGERRLPWHYPTITRIEIRRTMLGSGPNNDTGQPFP